MARYARSSHERLESAAEQALSVGWYYVDSNPAMSSMGLRTLERLVAHPPAMP